MKKNSYTHLALAFLMSLMMLFSFVTTAQTENALSFDNVDDEVLVPNASASIAGSTQITLTCWVKPENTNISFPDYDGFAGIRNNSNADFYMVQFGQRRVEARFRNSNGVNFDVIDTAIQTGVWQHYALTYNGSELTLYRNGFFVATTIANGSISNTAEPLHIGSMPYSSFNYFMNGDLDEITLWTRALTPGEIRCLARFGVPATASGLQHYFKCNQGTPGGINVSQTSLTDETGHANGVFSNFSLSGNLSNFVAGVITVNDISAQFCPGSSYTFGTQTLTAPGIYTQLYPTLGGCDSTVRLNLSYLTLNDSVVSSGSVLTALGTGYSYQWVYCQSGYQPIPGETNASFSPSVNGDYAVIVNDGSCSDTSSCVSVTTAGINSTLNRAAVSVYPNPVNDRLVIELPVSLADFTVQVTDASGRIVYRNVHTGSKAELTAASWSGGVYMLLVSTADGSYVTTVTK
ncbi:MAG: hypothetical protein RL213_313 [Bacteroidota bacterium]